MVSRKIARRLLVLVLSVALATGYLSATQAAQSDVGTVATAGDMPMPHHCNGCAGSEKAIPSALCGLSFCGIAAAAAATTTYRPIVAEPIESVEQPPKAGHIFPPDPYPPRPTVLS
jgi:hypothetical protein